MDKVQVFYSFFFVRYSKSETMNSDGGEIN